MKWGMYMEYSRELMQAIDKAQIDEKLGSIIYEFMAKREKNSDNKKILLRMARDEQEHALVWQRITNKNLAPSKIRILFLKTLVVILGLTFVVKIMQKAEQMSQAVYNDLEKSIPEAARMFADERRHESELYDLLDEEKLHYVGAIVLGLNDALVELTGALSGVTFALANNKLIAMTGIVTGISATFSMAASNYLAERASGNKNALKSSLYTGIAYLITVILLVLPYLLLPSTQYILAFAIMFVVVVLIILFFNYYISVAKGEKFLKNFMEMFVISTSVAILSFVIGLLAKHFLGIDAI